MPPSRGTKRKQIVDAATSKQPKTPKPAQKKSSNDEEAVVPADIPWPDHFKDLERVHRALNLVYTFCCTRKNLATTFENLKSAVEGHIKRELVVSDIAQIKFLAPNSIHFEYVNEKMLQVYIAASSNSSKDDAFSMTSTQISDVKEVLLFEFVDGDLRRSVVKKLNETKAPNSRGSREEHIKIPTFSMPQMTKLITKRNTKFSNAVNLFLKRCAETEIDPVESIKNQHLPHLPIRSDSEATTPACDLSTLPPDIPKERKPISEILEEVKNSDVYHGQIVENGHRIFPPQEPIYGDLIFPLSQGLVNALYTAHDITRLYSHQAEAINNLHLGNHVIVSTSTSSGKSLIYQIPVLHELEHDRDTKAMFIFPTKALAQDQKRSLIEALEYMEDALGHVQVDTFDGDTPKENRKRIRDQASVIFTNPDMLHLNILPNEEQWRMFLKHLKYVVVDELHVYNGIFGTHVAFIMRRLRRICSAVGNNKIRFVSCSATVANPKEHMRTIFGIDAVKLTDMDGSPAGLKEFVCWNTPFKDPGDPTSGRGDSVVEAAKVFTQLILRGVRTIAFCRVRNVCELMTQAVHAELQRREKGDVVSRVMAYRGGYTAQDRRRIEKEMFQGHLLGIVATNALELGVDIGSLDAVVIVNFPYNISNLRQQSGRAGRRNKDSLSVLIGGPFPTDQYYMENPDEIFLKPNADLCVDLTNSLVLEGHVQCAAYEMPIEPARDRMYFRDDLPSIAETKLVKDPGGFYHANESYRPYPAQNVNIRDTEDDHFVVVDITANRNLLLEEIEPSRAIFTIYTGGIFLHQGRSYLIREVSATTRIAQVEAVNVDWTTSQRDYTDVDPVESQIVHTLASPSPCISVFGRIQITSVVFGFFKLDRRKRIIDAVDVIDHPPLVRQAKGFWIDIPKRALDIMKTKRIHTAGAIHAAEHAVMAFIGSAEVRTECKAPEKEFAKRLSARRRPARLIFYDVRGASGICRKAFEQAGDLLERGLKRIESCKSCEEGCPECCAGERCNEGNAVLCKTGAVVILRCLLGLEVDVESLPENPGGRDWRETIVPAGKI